MLNIFIMGGGAGGLNLLSHLTQIGGINISGISDINPKAPGIVKARMIGVPVYDGDIMEIFNRQKMDLVFNLTGNPDINTRLENLPNRSFQLVTGECTHLILGIIANLEEKDLQMKMKYEEHRILSEISMAMALSKTANQIFDTIVRGGIEISGMSAGSLSIYNPDKKELFLVSAHGFSSEFYTASHYKIRPGGLTEYILSQKEPVIVPNIGEMPAFNNPILLKEGVQSLIALPLISDQGPVGILYVDDFTERILSSTVIDVLKLLATQATIAIQKQQAFEQIKALSVCDPLTGLYNRRYLNEILTTEMDRAYRLERPLSVILFDIDHFKVINDRFGHMTGDHVLKGLAVFFTTMLRRYDVYCRFGGDEMLILLADTNIDGAEYLAERLRVKAAEANLLPEGTSLSCSFGINVLNTTEMPRLTPDEFLHRADQALYDAKTNGRNRVIAFHPNLIQVKSKNGINTIRWVTRPSRREN